MCEIKKLEAAALEVRKDLLKLCSAAVLHIGGDLSAADVMTVLWQYQMKYNPREPHAENRDRFILSKGHAAAVMSFNQAAIGCFPKEAVFKEYATDMGRFSMHSCRLVNPYVEVSTGSLGHGMPIACGIAAALRLKKNFTSRVYTLMGDGEQSEGSIWEAALNAVHCKLGNLVALIDFNKLEADGSLEEITALGDIAEKYRTFGWNVTEINGNNITEIKTAFDSLPLADANVPTVIVCHTIKGCSVRFMENCARWHTGKITHEQYTEAVLALQTAFDKKWGSIRC